MDLKNDSGVHPEWGDADLADGGILASVPPRVALLREAEGLTSGDRRREYGEPVESHEHIARIFNAWVGSKHGVMLTGQMVAEVLTSLKLARLTTTPDHRDSHVDAMNYLGIRYECVEAES